MQQWPAGVALVRGSRGPTTPAPVRDTLVIDANPRKNLTMTPLAPPYKASEVNEVM